VLPSPTVSPHARCNVGLRITRPFARDYEKRK
jgi:hypothetical protein